jgi:hypothetical protein
MQRQVDWGIAVDAARCAESASVSECRKIRFAGGNVAGPDGAAQALADSRSNLRGDDEIQSRVRLQSR